MIDPKLDKLPVKNTGEIRNDRSGSEEQGLTDAVPAGRGLSVNDTIAADANLSVGSRGVDTSGVRSGAGAGAGHTFVSPGLQGGSPAPNIAPGPRGSGTTTLGNAGAEQTPTMRKETTNYTTSDDSSAGDLSLSQEEISAHAYRCWHERGCPEGSAEEDWARAERELRERRIGPKTSSASA